MALTKIGSAAADGTTITIPAGHRAGDIIILYAYNNAGLAIALNAGWTNINAATATSSFRFMWRLATSSADTSGTWANSTGLICVVFRGQATNKTPVGAGSLGNSALANITWTQVIMKAPQTSWLVAFGAISSTASAIESPPSGMTLQTNTVGAAVEYVYMDSAGIYNKGTWPATVVNGGVAAEWRTHMLEVLAEGPAPINNYQFVKVGDGLSVGERIR